MDNLDDPDVRKAIMLDLGMTEYEVIARRQALSSAFNLAVNLPLMLDFDKQIQVLLNPDVMADEEWALMIEHRWGNVAETLQMPQ